MGIAGLGIILFFLVMAVTAPILIPWPRPIEVNLAPSICAPTWLMGLDPSGFIGDNPVPNPYFDSDASGWDYFEKLEFVEYLAMYSNFSIPINDTGWAYSTTGSTAPLSSGFDDSDGFPLLEGGSGPGSYEFSYTDTATGTAYGATTEILSYKFEFDPNKFGNGTLEDYPYRVYLQYAYSIEFYCNVSEMGDSEIFMKWMLENSTGESYRFRRYRWTSPSDTAFRESFQYEMPLENITRMFPESEAGATNLTLIIKLEYTNPTPADTFQVALHFDDIKLVIGSTYNETVAGNTAIISGAFDPDEGSDLDTQLATGSGDGCYHFVYNEDDKDIAYPNASAWVEYTFDWNLYDTPRAAYLNYQYMVTFTGEIGDARVKIAQEMYVENTSHTEVILLGSYIMEDRPWTASPHNVFNAFQLGNTFAHRGTLRARWKVVVFDPTPKDTPIIDVYFDDLVLELHGDYFGALGSGQYGEDLLAQLLWGARIALLVGLLSAAIATFVGLIVGLVSGYFGGMVDEILMRVTDFFLIIPGLPLMIVLAAILGAGWYNIVLVIALIGWTGTARLVRSQVLAERQRAYVEAARAIGASDLYIIFRHVLPNVTPLLFAQITLGVAGSILSEAGLAFLGLTHPNDVSWGRMLMQASQGGAYSAGAWWYVMFPGVCIVLLALSFTLVGYAIDEILNPRLRVRGQ